MQIQDVMNPWRDRRSNYVKTWAKSTEKVLGPYVNFKLEYLMRV